MSNKISSNRSFGILFFLFFLLISIWPLINGAEVRIWSLVLSLIFLILGLLNSKYLAPFNKAWVKFGELLGRIIAPLVMAIIFFFVVTPLGLIIKLFGKDLLKTKFIKTNSYWLKREKNVTSMRKQF
ncbi:MAG: SxtJ family membrane protein [Pelagibacteraceae bacterium]|tara:strand:- start:59 stop:439 length:381 start_codon:yes stop_codon:yes gene_type:complete